MARGRARQNVLGAAKLIKVFKQLPKESIKRMTHALNKGSEEIKALAKITAKQSDPIAGKEHYADTIRISRIRANAATARRSEFVSIAVLAGGTKETSAAAWRSEFGRKPGPKPKRAAKKGHTGHDPQPALLPAYFAIRKKVRSRIKREINRAAKAVAASRTKA